jgi:hypothetical protein
VFGRTIAAMKRIVALLSLVVLVLASWAIYSKVIQHRRDAAYAAAMAPFKRDLRSGLSRTDVADYLTSRNIVFNGVKVGGAEGLTYEVQVGEEPGSLVCESWTVYVAMEFDASDRLTEVHLRKVGTCL